MKMVTIVGARPQFIKAAEVSRAIAKHNINHKDVINEIIVHTGQHYDRKMSDVFFKQLELKEPDYNLGVSGFSHGAMTGRMLESIEKVLLKEIPQYVLTYGDTNSTLAGALAASKLHIPVAHVEAGLRSFNMNMPEEINRLLTDNVSTLLFCPTTTAVDNLKKEGITKGVYQVGDVMYDATLYYKERVMRTYDISQWNVEDKNYVLCTIHREENTDNLSKLENIFAALKEIQSSNDVILPIHPRTKKIIDSNGKKDWLKGLKVIEPLSYLEMMRLEISAKAIMTDSGGIQKEAYFHQVPCITLRDETEWKETVEQGWNQVVGTDKTSIINAFRNIDTIEENKINYCYGNGNAANEIINVLLKSLKIN